MDDLIKRAPAVPLTDQVRIDRKKALGAIENIRPALPLEFSRSSESLETPQIVDQLESLVREAPEIPLTAHVRFERETAYDLIDRLVANLSVERQRLRWEAAGEKGEQAEREALRALALAFDLEEVGRQDRRSRMGLRILIDPMRTLSLLSELRTAIRNAGDAGSEVIDGAQSHTWRNRSPGLYGANRDVRRRACVAR